MTAPTLNLTSTTGIPYGKIAELVEEHTGYLGDFEINASRGRHGKTIYIVEDTDGFVLLNFTLEGFTDLGFEEACRKYDEELFGKSKFGPTGELDSRPKMPKLGTDLSHWIEIFSAPGYLENIQCVLSFPPDQVY